MACAFLSSLYPTLTVIEVTHEYPVASIPAHGVESGRLIDQHSFLLAHSSHEQCVVLASSIRPDILSHINRLAAIISLREDSSSHLSIVCRSKGIPIVNVSTDVLVDLSSLTHQYVQCAVSTFQQRIYCGLFHLDKLTHLTRRRLILDGLHGKLPFDITSNADTAEDVSKAVSCGFRKFWPRSETLLYTPTVLNVFRSLLVFPSAELSALFKAAHQASIVALLKSASSGRLVFRLLDPPGHEFVPDADDTTAMGHIASLAEKSLAEVRAALSAQREANPMIGYRGARLLLTHPYLLRAQVLALCDAWTSLPREEKPKFVEIFVPFIITHGELRELRSRIFSIIQDSTDIPLQTVRFGSMIETPSILEYPEEVAALTDFVSFGTNDLAAIFYGLSRGDCYEAYMRQYIELGLIEEDPFFEFSDALLRRIVTFSRVLRQANPNVEIDICGEQTMGSNIWRAVRERSFTSISIGVENLPAFLANMCKEKYINEKYEPIP